MADVEIAHTPEDISAFKAANKDEIQTLLFHKGHPNEGFWNSLITSFMTPQSTAEIEDDKDTHLLKIDCQKERLEDVCDYYDAVSLPEVQVIKDGNVVLKEKVNDQTEAKIESIRSGKPLEVEVEFDRKISPTPVLIEDYDERLPEPKKEEPKKEEPKKDHPKLHAFGQDHEIKKTEVKSTQHTRVAPSTYDPTRRIPQQRTQMIPQYLSRQPQPYRPAPTPQTYTYQRPNAGSYIEVVNPFNKDIGFHEAQIKGQAQTVTIRDADEEIEFEELDPSIPDSEQDVIYIPLTDDDLEFRSEYFIVDEDDPGEVFYVFSEYDNEGHISPLQDLSTRDPNEKWRGILQPADVVDEIPKDRFGRDAFPKYESYIPPISIKKDNRPYFERHENRENDYWIKGDDDAEKDENYIPTYTFEPLIDELETREELPDQYYIPSLGDDREVHTKVNKVDLNDDSVASVVEEKQYIVPVSYDPDAVSTNVVTVGRTGD